MDRTSEPMVSDRHRLLLCIRGFQGDNPSRRRRTFWEDAWESQDQRDRHTAARGGGTVVAPLGLLQGSPGLNSTRVSYAVRGTSLCPLRSSNKKGQQPPHNSRPV